MDPRAPLSTDLPAGVAGRVLPMQPGEACGDAVGCFDPPPGGEPGRLLAIVDGLGHGEEAAHAAQLALRCLADAPGATLPELFERLDAALRASRGAAIGLVRVAAGRLLHAGVGNTRAMRLREGRMTRLSSQHGIVGGGLPGEVVVTTLDLVPGDWLLLFSDGVNEMVQLPVALPEWQRDPALLCEHLLERWRLPRDDAGVLVMQVGAG